MATNLSLTGSALRGVVADTRHPQYQEIKSRVHANILNRLNLDRLASVKREDAEPEIRSVIFGMLDEESKTTPLSLREREQLISDILNELFGLGPLEELLKDPAIFRHPREQGASDLHRAERPARRDEGHVQGQSSSPPHHRAHRQLRRTPHRRVEPDG